MAAQYCDLTDRKTAKLVRLLEECLDEAEKLAARPRPVLAAVSSEGAGR